MQLRKLTFRLYFKQHHCVCFQLPQHLDQTLLLKVSQNSPPTQEPSHGCMPHDLSQASRNKSWHTKPTRATRHSAFGACFWMANAFQGKNKAQDLKRGALLLALPQGHVMTRIKEVPPKGHYSSTTCRTGGTACHRHVARRSQRPPEGQALLTSPLQVLGLTTMEIKQAENRLWLRCEKAELFLPTTAGFRFAIFCHIQTSEKDFSSWLHYSRPELY